MLNFFCRHTPASLFFLLSQVLLPEFRISHEAILCVVYRIFSNFFPDISYFVSMYISIGNRDTGTGENISFRGNMQPLPACHAACCLHDLRNCKNSGTLFFLCSGYKIVKFSHVFWGHDFRSMIHPPASGNYFVEGEFMDSKLCMQECIILQARLRCPWKVPHIYLQAALP